MSATEPWNIARITEALPSADLRMRFLSEANLAPVATIQDVLIKWQHIAEQLTAAYERALELHAYEKEHGHLHPDLVRVSPEELARIAELDSKGAA